MSTAPKRIVNSLYNLYLALLASQTLNPSNIEVDPTAGLDPSKVDAVRVLAREQRLNQAASFTEGELDNELAILFGGRSNEQLQQEVARLQGETSALRERLAETDQRLYDETNRRYAAEDTVRHVKEDLTAVLNDRPAYEGLNEEQKEDVSSLLHLTIETVQKIEQGLVALAEDAHVASLVAKDAIKAHRTDLVLIAWAMGIPLEVAAGANADVLIEMMHALFCAEHGTVQIPGAANQGEARTDLIRTTLLATIEKVNAQPKSERMATEGRQLLGGAKVPSQNPLAALIAEIEKLEKGPAGKGMSAQEEAFLSMLLGTPGKANVKTSAPKASSGVDPIEILLQGLFGGPATA